MPSEPVAHSIDTLRAGLTAEFEREITESGVLEFAANTGDYNPLHTDAAYASTTNFEKRIVHGAFQVGLASAMIGMHLPGRDVLLSNLNATFPSPLYFPCRALVSGEITSWNPETTGGRLRVLVREASTKITTADIQMGFTLHQARKEKLVPANKPVSQAPRTTRRKVIVTGASGGLGSAITAALNEDFFVYGLVNRNPLDAGLKGSPNVCELHADLSADDWREVLAASLGDEPIYAIVHAAWPGMPRGGLLETPDDVVESQLLFGACQTVRLGRFLFDHVGSSGGRLIVLGSVAGSAKPMVNYGAYSLGKVVLEHTTRLLASELALKQITANTICPSFVATGLNKQTTDRQRMQEAARIPLARLCETADVAGLIRYLLSPDAGFISGEVIRLTGGEL